MSSYVTFPNFGLLAMDGYGWLPAGQLTNGMIWSHHHYPCPSATPPPPSVSRQKSATVTNDRKHPSGFRSINDYYPAAAAAV